jgi:hypothetical protein
MAMQPQTTEEATPFVAAQLLVQEKTPPALPCAWCLREQGTPITDGSHGICIPHKDAMLEQYRKLNRGGKQ